MARFGRRERDPHRLRIAHLADDDDIWRLTHHSAESRRKIWRVDSDFNLFDDTIPMLMFVLDRVFNRDDVLAIAAIDGIDESGQRRCLAGSCCSTDKNESWSEARQAFN